MRGTSLSMAMGQRVLSEESKTLAEAVASAKEELKADEKEEEGKADTKE